MDMTVVIVAAIGAFASIGGAVLTLLINRKVSAVHKEMNGMKTELVRAVGDARKAEGIIEGAHQQKIESETTAHDVVQALKDDKDIDISKTK